MPKHTDLAQNDDARPTQSRLMRRVEAFVPSDITGVEERRRARLAVIIPLAIMCVGVIGAIAMMAFGRFRMGIFMLVILALCGATAGLIKIVRPVSVVVNIQLALITVSVAASVARHGGPGMPGLYALAVVSLMGWLMLGRKGGLIWTGIVSLVVLAEYVMQGAGWFPPFDQDGRQFQRLHAFSAVMIIWLLTAVSVFYNSMKDESLREVQAAKRTAERASQVKSAFLANMSHEIRTPLNGILGMLELLQRTELSTVQKERVETVVTSGESLLAIVNDILDLSKIESGQITVASERYEPLDLVEAVVTTYATAATARDLDLAMQVGDEVPAHLLGDPQRLRQVLTNLVSNAIKFTESGGVVLKVSCSDGSRLNFSVKDTGIGVDPNDQERLFDPFVQVDSSAARRRGGTGLGLSICRQLVELLGGDLRLKSQLGEGSTFYFSLPIGNRSAEGVYEGRSLRPGRVLVAARSFTQHMIVRTLQAVEARAVDTCEAEEFTQRLRDAEASGKPYALGILDLRLLGRKWRAALDNAQGATRVLALSTGNVAQVGLIEAGFVGALTLPVCASRLLEQCRVHLRRSKSQTFDGSVSAAAAASVTPPPTQSVAHSRVLVAEDNPTNQAVVEGYLDALGLSCTVAGDGAQAVEAATQSDRTFDLVLMDCQMPEVDGYQAARAIREHESKAGISPLPIIALTANAMPGDRERALEAGMNDYIAKPLKLGALRDVLSKHLATPLVEE